MTDTHAARATAPYAPTAGPDDEAALARATVRRVTGRLMPFLFLLYVFNYLDRTNVSIAALQMNRDLRFSAGAFGLGAGIFFVGYALCEVPSNLLLARIGPRWWIARIMITWGVIASAMMLVRTPVQFYALRFLLGVAEAGFFPGIIYYLSQWFPAAERGRAGARFMIAIPLASALGGAVGGTLLGLDGRLGIAGWQWLFLAEGIPSVLLGFVVLRYLTARPADARWLTAAQRDWLVARLERDHDASAAPHGVPPLRTLLDPVVWLLGLPYLCIIAAGYGYQFWGPTIVRDTLHTSDTRTSLVIAAIAVVTALAMLAIGASSDRSGERHLHAAAAGVVVAAGYAGAALLPTPLGRILALALVGIGASAFLVPFWCLTPMLFRGSAMAAAIALVNSIGNVGGFFGPNVIGVAKTLTGGTTGAFLVLGGIGLTASALCLVLRRVPAFRGGGA
jgi:ACS family tartrate transporter-like MFS transporter